MHFVKQAIIGLLYTIFFSINSTVTAIPMPDLYSIAIPAPDNSVKQRKLLMLDGFKQVLAKVSSQKSAMTQKELAKVTKQLDKYISKFYYKENCLYIDFNKKMVNNLLNQLGYAYLPNNRPLTLIHLNFQDPIIVATIEQMATARGLPIVMPLMDLQDINNSDPYSINQRYGTDLMLTGKISKFAGYWQSTWIIKDHSADTNYNSITFKQSNLTEQVEELMDFIALNLFQRYHDLNNLYSITVSIDNINNLEQYTKIFNYLKSLPMINLIEADNINQNYASFALQVAGGNATLKKAISSNNNLELKESTNELLRYKAKL